TRRASIYKSQDSGGTSEKTGQTPRRTKILECTNCATVFSCSSSFKGRMRSRRGEKVMHVTRVGRPSASTPILTRGYTSGNDPMRVRTVGKPSDPPPTPWITGGCALESGSRSVKSVGKPLAVAHLSETTWHTVERSHTFVSTVTKPSLATHPLENIQGHTVRRSPTNARNALEGTCLLESRLCEQCGKTFSCQAYFQTHLKMHSGAKPHTCAQRGRDLGFSAPLHIHVRTHPGESPRMPADAQRREDFLPYVHRTSHRERWPYLCGRCGRVHRSSPSFRAHMRTHTGERPYECKQCGKAFVSIPSFRGHVKIHARQDL
ncbi:hypothetical protein U0070_008474, partial [Myodes glareolus]